MSKEYCTNHIGELQEMIKKNESSLQASEETLLKMKARLQNQNVTSDGSTALNSGGGIFGCDSFQPAR